jgi:hypothetical protein
MPITSIKLLSRRICVLLILVIFVGSFFFTSAYADETFFASENNNASVPIFKSKVDNDIWCTQVGNGFRKGTQVFNLGAGATYGLLILGSEERHHLAYGLLSYGRMLSGLKGEGHWYSGNWELQVELFSGGQYNSDSAYVIGLLPHLRYNFASGSRWMPFVDAGFGVSLTNIDVPDLGGIFQFNTQLGAGTQWFVKDNMAITFKGLFMHISSAGIYSPNKGVNTAGIELGVAWYF